MKSNITVIVTGLLIVLLTAGCKSTTGKTNTEAHPTPKGRFVVILRDVTRSFQFYDETNKKILTIVNALGPGDALLLAEITMTFLPQKNVRVQCNIPEVPPSLLQPTSNLSQWKRNQAQLNAIWAAVKKNRQTIANWLRKNPVKIEKGGTDLFTALDYCAKRLDQDSEKEKYLFIFSDLIHELKGEKTEKPRSEPLNFQGVYVSVLSVPWQGQKKWESKKKDWEAWFKQGGAVEFAMYDPADSKLQSLLKQSGVPKKLLSPFN